MNNDSKKQILKATSIIGGGQFLTIITGIIRTKVVAILLGPYGIGIAGMLQSILDIVRNLTGFGLNYSAVKFVAEADQIDNQTKINETISVLKKLALITGFIGMILMCFFSSKLSLLTFGNLNYRNQILFLSIILLFTSISGGQMALLQGKRELKKMSKASIYGAISTSIVSILVYFSYGIKGVVPVFLISSLIPLFFSWYYSRNIQFLQIRIPITEVLTKGYEMAKLGFFIVVTGFMSTLTLYIVRSIISSKLNIDSVGFFQASWMITTTYIGIILNSMLADFFPRLSAVNQDNFESNKLINEQLEIALLLGTPMIIGLMAFSPLIIQILYSNSFLMTVPLLQWQLYGSFITLIMWPIGVMFLSKNKGIYSILTDGVWSFSYLLIVYIGWQYFNFIILGIAFLIASLFKLFFVVLASKKIGKFYFNEINKKIIFQFFLITTIMLLNVRLLHNLNQYIITITLLIVIIYISFSKLKLLYSNK